jgi:hypothetical protein
MTGHPHSDATLLGLGDRFTADELVQAVVAWHFDPRTGSPFWLERAAGLGFDPRRDVRTVSDLARFPDVSAELTRVPAGTLLPRGCQDPVRVFESGGTLGSPKRIIETGSRRRALSWVDSVLRRHGTADDRGGWLHVGPTGPHIVGRSVGLLAEARGAICFYVDFDPRWVRRLLRRGDRAAAGEYIAHVLDQVQDVLSSQQVSVVVITPPVLEAASARPELEKLLSRQVRTLIWTGTSMTAETLRLFSEEVFPSVTMIGLYGNSLMGIAPQRPPRPDDPVPCVFTPYHPFALVEVISPGSGKPVPPGHRGRLRVNLLSRDMFLPAVPERDSALRLPPVDGYGPGLGEVAPYRGQDQEIIEGVY